MSGSSQAPKLLIKKKHADETSAHKAVATNDAPTKRLENNDQLRNLEDTKTIARNPA